MSCSAYGVTSTSDIFGGLGGTYSTPCSSATALKNSSRSGVRYGVRSGSCSLYDSGKTKEPSSKDDSVVSFFFEGVVTPINTLKSSMLLLYPLLENNLYASDSAFSLVLMSSLNSSMLLLYPLPLNSLYAS